MFKRFPRITLLALLGGLLLTSACTAAPHAAAPYVEGQQYVKLSPPYQRYSDKGKVELAEVFSYGCIHCAHFAPMADRMRKALPAGVHFSLVPAPFNDEWLPYARAYYAADKLGVVPQTHLALFAAKFDQHYPINSLDDLADFYARHGVDRARFMSLANSPAATAKMKSDLALLQKWGVDGTPTLVVDGKYRVTGVKTEEEMVKVAVWLAHRDLQQKH